MPKPTGATDLEILNEPDWTQSHSHRVGVRNRDDRFPGLTHEGDDWRYELEKEAERRAEELRAKAKRGELLTVRDFFQQQEVSISISRFPSQGLAMERGLSL